MNLGDENTEHGKSQLVRLLDVFFIGPMMIWGGRRASGPGGVVLSALGVATIVYNARNYLRISELDQASAPARREATEHVGTSAAMAATSTRLVGLGAYTTRARPMPRRVLRLEAAARCAPRPARVSVRAW